MPDEGGMLVTDFDGSDELEVAPKLPQSDTLRTRIAAVSIRQRCCADCVPDAKNASGAKASEVDIRNGTATSLNGCYSRMTRQEMSTMTDLRHPISTAAATIAFRYVERHPQLEIRYVTEWETDDV